MQEMQKDVGENKKTIYFSGILLRIYLRYGHLSITIVKTLLAILLHHFTPLAFQKGSFSNTSSLVKHISFTILNIVFSYFKV